MINRVPVTFLVDNRYIELVDVRQHVPARSSYLRKEVTTRQLYSANARHLPAEL